MRFVNKNLLGLAGGLSLKLRYRNDLKNSFFYSKGFEKISNQGLIVKFSCNNYVIDKEMILSIESLIAILSISPCFVQVIYGVSPTAKSCPPVG